MSTKDLTERNGGSARRGLLSSPLVGLHKEVDRLFDDFMGDFRPWRSGIRLWDDSDGELVPKVDVSETDKEVQVTADLPGIDEKDIEVTLSDGVLTIKMPTSAKAKSKVKKISVKAA